VPDDSRLKVIPWREDELVVVAAPSHPLAPQAPIPMAALADEMLVLRERGSGTRRIVLDLLKAHNVIPQRTLGADSVESIKHIVAAGLGLSIVSRAAIEDMLALRRLVVLDVTDCHMTRPLNRIMRRGGQSAAARAFVALLRGEPNRVDRSSRAS
jgi:DNA-binding transcriptional LysR family regulator